MSQRWAHNGRTLFMHTIAAGLSAPASRGQTPETPYLSTLARHCPTLKPLEGAAATGDTGDMGVLRVGCHLEQGPLATSSGAVCWSLLVWGLGPGQVAEQSVSHDSGSCRGP